MTHTPEQVEAMANQLVTVAAGCAEADMPTLGRWALESSAMLRDLQAEVERLGREVRTIASTALRDRRNLQAKLDRAMEVVEAGRWWLEEECTEGYRDSCQVNAGVPDEMACPVCRIKATLSRLDAQAPNSEEGSDA